MVTIITDQLLQQSLDDVISSPQYGTQSSKGYGVVSFTHKEDDVESSHWPQTSTLQLAPVGHLVFSVANTPGTVSHSNCDQVSPFDLLSLGQDALSPTQVPPAKRHRRSASIPGGTRSENQPAHRRSSRYRQSIGILHPVAVRPNVSSTFSLSQAAHCQSGLSRNAAACHQQQSDYFSGFTFSGSNFLRPDVLPTGKPVNLSFDADEMCSFLAASGPNGGTGSSSSSVGSLLESQGCVTPASVVVAPDGRQSSFIVRSSKYSPLATRCHSQPGAMLSRRGSLKRRRDDGRPQLDFLKMRETAYSVEAKSYTQGSDCNMKNSKNQAPDYLTANSDEHLANVSFSSWRPSRELCHSTTPVAERSERSCSSARLDSIPSPAVSPSIPLEGSASVPSDGQLPVDSSGEDDRPVLHFSSCLAVDDDSSTESLDGELDLELIERN